MQNQTLIVRICRKPSNPFQVKLTWKSKKAYPFGGKYDLLSALWGQSTTKGPKRRKLALISSERKNRQFVSITRVRFSFFFCAIDWFYLHRCRVAGLRRKPCVNSARPIHRILLNSWKRDSEGRYEMVTRPGSDDGVTDAVSGSKARADSLRRLRRLRSCRNNLKADQISQPRPQQRHRQRQKTSLIQYQSQI